jgi:acyl-CoA oxidase
MSANPMGVVGVAALAVCAATFLFWRSKSKPNRRKSQKVISVYTEAEQAKIAAYEEKFSRFLSPLPPEDDISFTANHEAMKKVLTGQYIDISHIIEQPMEVFYAHRAIVKYDNVCALSIRCTVQYNLYCGSVMMLGSDEQRDWLRETCERGETGCFALTEIGAGVLSGLVLEATCDWNGKGFTLNTPTDAAQKIWISQGMTARWAVVMARLRFPSSSADGEMEDKGAHAFLVDLRTPGFDISSMAPKSQFNSLDNARIAAKNVKLPRSSLLSRYCSVDTKGNYSAVGGRFSFLRVVSRLFTGRLCIADTALRVEEQTRLQCAEYLSQRRVYVDKFKNTVPLLELPVFSDLAADMAGVSRVLQKFVYLTEWDFSRHATTTPEKDMSLQLVDDICICKMEGVEFTLHSHDKWRCEVGSFSVMAEAPFGHLKDIILCMRFAEGDTRVLQMKTARDKITRMSLLTWPLRYARHYLSDDKLAMMEEKLALKLAWNMMGVSKARQMNVWNANYATVFPLARAHALRRIHDRISQVADSKDDCEAFVRYALRQLSSM